MILKRLEDGQRGAPGQPTLLPDQQRQDNNLRERDLEGLSITGCVMLDTLLNSPPPSFSFLICTT